METLEESNEDLRKRMEDCKNFCNDPFINSLNNFKAKILMAAIPKSILITDGEPAKYIYDDIVEHHLADIDKKIVEHISVYYPKMIEIISLLNSVDKQL